MAPVKTMLITLSEANIDRTPFYKLAETYNLKVDFRSFTHIEGVTPQEFRNQKIYFSDYNSIILTSKTAVDHLFGLAQELRADIPEDIRFFCISEAIALYLQKYIPYRKRKIIVGQRHIADLIPLMKQYKNHRFLLPCSDKLRNEIPEALTTGGIQFTKAVMYRTVISDLSDLENVFYDMLVFFSPSSIESLFTNFPDFRQNNTLLAIFGTTTAKAAEKKELRIDVRAPNPLAPSMINAIELFLKNTASKQRIA